MNKKEKKESTELYKILRPTTFKQVVGQDVAISKLKSFVKKDKVPDALLFVGPSGTGKTTTARILFNVMGIEDIFEIDGATKGGVESARDIKRQMYRFSLHGTNRGFLLDEWHMASKEAQNGLLKTLEDTVNGVTFIICTTDPQRLLPTFKSRCTQINFQSIEDDVLLDHLKRTCKKQKIKVDKKVLRLIAQSVDGSARQAMVVLNSVMHIKSTKKQIAAVDDADAEKVSKTIAQLLMDRRSTWKQVGIALQQTQDDPERLRRGIIGYAAAVLKKCDNPRAFLIIECFQSHLYDSGMAGLVGSCYQVIKAK